MPLDLHQRLSEFSYGYGVTREVQQYLESVGLRPVPFFPNLLHEAELGFDVAFDRPGAPVLLQFKLGEELLRFRRTNSSSIIPRLDRPFWRFNVDTAELNGQYDLLLKSERAGAEVYYVAPRFADWDDYAAAFQNEEVVERSLLLQPSEIDSKLAAQSDPDGNHRIVYDDSRVYVCSEPARVKEVELDDIATKLRTRILERDEPVTIALKKLYEGLSLSRDLRAPPPDTGAADRDAWMASVSHERPSRSPAQLAADRQTRLETFRKRAKTEEDALFATIGVETWAVGSELMIVTAE